MLDANPAQSILVIEDSDCYQLLIKEAFKLLGLSDRLTLVSTAEDGLSWLKRRRDNQPDLIFLDLHLPQMSGHQLLEIIKNDPKTRKIPILILSDSIESKEILRSYQLQANCHLKKPTNIDDLLYCLQTIFNFWFSVAVLPTEFSSPDPFTPFY